MSNFGLQGTAYKWMRAEENLRGHRRMRSDEPGLGQEKAPAQKNRNLIDLAPLHGTINAERYFLASTSYNAGRERFLQADGNATGGPGTDGSSER